MVLTKDDLHLTALHLCGTQAWINLVAVLKPGDKSCWRQSELSAFPHWLLEPLILASYVSSAVYPIPSQALSHNDSRPAVHTLCFLELEQICRQCVPVCV